MSRSATFNKAIYLMTGRDPFAVRARMKTDCTPGVILMARPSLNRGRSAKMCFSLNSGYPLTFRLNSRDSAALPLSVTCTSRYPGARVIHPFCRNSVISAELSVASQMKTSFAPVETGAAGLTPWAGVQYCAKAFKLGFTRLTSGPGHLPPAIFPSA